MSTESQIKSENIWAAVKGAAASTAVIFIGLVASVLVIPSTPEDDGHIRGAAILAGFLPIVLGVLFVYYLALSARENRPLKFALLVQTIIILPFALFIFYVAFPDAGFFIAALNAFYTFSFFSVVGLVGAWAWSKSQNT